MGRAYQVAEAKAKLSEILRQVKLGRSVTIAERGKSIARVVPISPSESLADRIARLEEDGTIVAGTGTTAAIAPVRRRPGALRRFIASRK